MREVIFSFTRLGWLGFGGPIATVAMMQEEFALRRKWVTEKKFTEMIAICKLLPGPLSTQMAVFLGQQRLGTPGGIAAGVAFILPSFLIVLGLSYLYVSTHWVGHFEALFSGFQAGALAVIVLSTIQLSKPYWKNRSAWGIGLISTVIIAGFPRIEPVMILAFGLFGIYFLGKKSSQINQSSRPSIQSSDTTLRSVIPFSVTAVLFHGKVSQIFWSCFKAGAFVFGSGLAIVPMLEGDSVSHFHWLTHREFMDGLALGQITPGPVVITATFIGYKAAGFAGAVAGTLGIFLPSFFNILYLVPRIWGRWSASQAAEKFALGAIPAVIGGIAGSVLRLGALSFHSVPIVMIFSGIFALGFWKKLPGWMLILISGASAPLLDYINKVFFI